MIAMILYYVEWWVGRKNPFVQVMGKWNFPAYGKYPNDDMIFTSMEELVVLFFFWLGYTILTNIVIQLISLNLTLFVIFIPKAYLFFICTVSVKEKIVYCMDKATYCFCYIWCQFNDPYTVYTRIGVYCTCTCMTRYIAREINDSIVNILYILNTDISR